MRFCRLHFLIGLLSLVGGSRGSAQSPEFNQLPFQHIEPIQGLRGSFMYGVCEDKNGFMWIASPRGLAKFDGANIDYFTVENGLPSNDILNCIEDQNGRVWAIGHKVAPVFLKNDRIHEVPGLRLETDESVIRIARGAGQKTWIFSNRSLYCYQEGKPIAEEQGFASEYQPQYVLLDDDGQEWFLSEKGMFAEKPSGRILVPFPDSLVGRTSGLRAVHGLPGQFLISGSGIGLMTFSPANRRWKALTIPLEAELSGQKWRVDKEGNLWGTDGQGITLLKKKEAFGTRHELLSEIRILTLKFDRDENLWISTPDDGLLLIRAPVLATWEWTQKDGLPGKKVTALAADSSGKIWAGFDNGSVAVLTGNEVQQIQFQSSNMDSRVVRTIHCAPDGKVWVAGANGLHCFPDPKTVFSYPIQEIKVMDPGPDGQLWLGGSSAILSFDPLENQDMTAVRHQGSVPPIALNLSFYNRHIRYDLPKGAYALIATEDGEVHAGNSEGIWNMREGRDPEKEAFGRSGSVSCFAHGPDGGIWTGTESKGLFFESKYEKLHFDRKNGLSGDYVQAIGRGGDGRFWIVTNSGINLIRTGNVAPEHWRPEALQMLHTVAGREFLSVLEFRDKLYLGTDRGLLVKDLARLNWKGSSPTTFLYRLEVGGQNRNTSNPVVLQADENEIAFHLRTIFPARGEKLSYNYRLRGADDEFRETDSPEIRFFNLSPGEYRFEFKGANHSGSAEAELKSLEFTILAKWHQRLAVRLPVLGFLVLLIVLIVRWRWRESRRLLEFKLLLQETQHQALQAQMNPHFIFNVMNVVQQHIIEGDVFAANQVLARIARLIRTVMEFVRASNITLEEEIQFLELYVSLENARLEEKVEFQCELAADIEPADLNIPSMLLQPLLENAFRHGFPQGFSKGHLRIAISREKSALKCTITDNGVGRENAASQPSATGQAHVSHGLDLTRKRLEVLSQRLQEPFGLQIKDLLDQEGHSAGTQIILSFPIL